MTDERFEYTRRPVVLALCGLVAVAAGALLFYVAGTGDQVRMGPIPIFVSGPPIYILSLVSMAFAVIAFYGVVKPILFGPSVLVVTTSWIEMPLAPIRRTVVRIHQEEVRHVARFTPGGRRILRLETADRKLEISSRFVGDEGVDAVERWLARGSRLDDYPSLT